MVGLKNSLVEIVLVALTAGLVGVWTPAAAADFDCGNGVELIFCPLKARAALVSEFMERGERIAYPTLDGINFFGQLVVDMADRVVVTEGLVVDTAEAILPGPNIVRGLEAVFRRGEGAATSISAVRASSSENLLGGTKPRPQRPAVLDYGRVMAEMQSRANEGR